MHTQTATVFEIKPSEATAEAPAGYYFSDSEYPDEGSCGPFVNVRELVEFAEQSGYALDYKEY